MDLWAAANPNPGWRPFQRLTRAEYTQAVKDLLDVDVDVTAYLPPDTMSQGFDNIADTQNFSPALPQGLSPCGRSDQPPGGGRSDSGADNGDLPRARDRESDAVRGRHAVRIARRHGVRDDPQFTS